MSLKETLKDVENQLTEVAEKLPRPPSSVDELLSLLDLAEDALGKVDQAPSKSMHDALSSLKKELVSDELLGHPDTDVKVSVASCISEITRITAPEAPYDDEKMKKVFRLIVSSFENLPDKASRSYTKRELILETVAKVRSCVIMLDLECDDLITEMFQIFFRTIRDYHSDNIFISMVTIMNLVVEESEEVSTDLLTTLLSSVKRDNEEVPPIARRLGESVLETCAVKLKPYLIQAIKYSGISLDNYSKIVNSVCGGAVGEDASNALVEHPSDGCKAAEASSEATQKGDGNKAATASSEETQVDDVNKAAVASSEQTQEGDSKAVAVSSGETQEGVKDVERDCLGDESPTATVSNGTDVTSKQKTSVKGELPQKGDTGETDNKSTNDEVMPKPESHALEVEESGVSESKKIPKNRRKPSSSSKSEESSEPSHVDGEKEAEVIPHNLDSHKKDTDSSLDEDISPKVKNVGSDQETGDIEFRKDANAASPMLNAGEGDENLLKGDDGHQQEKECATQGEVSTLDRPTEKESEKARDSPGASGESTDKKAPQESPLKDEVEVGTSKHEDSGISDPEDTPVKKPAKHEESGTSDSEDTPVKKPAKHEESGTSDSDDTPVKKPAKELHFSDSEDDGSLLKNSIKRARTKAKTVKGASKSSTKDDVKVVVSSQNRTAKTAKAEEHVDKIISKRKRSTGKGEASGSLKYGKNLIRSRIKVWWPMDQLFYEGVIVSYDPDKRKHQVVYVDGDEETLNLRKEKWEIIGDDSVTDDDAEPASPDASSEMPKSKKVKKSAASIVKQQGLDDVSPKRLSASSSKSKGKSSISGKKTKNDKVETKSKDGPSKSGADGSRSKSKAHSQKLSAKYVNDTPKSSGKAKELDNSTLKSKSKQDAPKVAAKSEDILKSGGKSKDTPKTAGKSKDSSVKTASKSKEDSTKTVVKGKTQGSGSKSNANGAVKEKSSLPKGKGNVQEKPRESSEVPEGTKRKLLDSSKDEGSEAKSSKKKKLSIKG